MTEEGDGGGIVPEKEGGVLGNVEDQLQSTYEDNVNRIEITLSNILYRDHSTFYTFLQL